MNSKEWRKLHPTYYIEYRKKNLDRVQSYGRKNMAKYSLKNKGKRRARKAVFAGIRNGSIVRKPCFCGNKKSEAHHTDYRKPLQIVWLCKKHHEKV